MLGCKEYHYQDEDTGRTMIVLAESEQEAEQMAFEQMRYPVLQYVTDTKLASCKACSEPFIARLRNGQDVRMNCPHCGRDLLVIWE